MPRERNAEQVIHLALIPVCAGENARNAGHLVAFIHRHAHRQHVGVFVREEVIYQVKARLAALPVIYRRHIFGHLEAKFVSQGRGGFHNALARHPHDHLPILMGYLGAHACGQRCSHGLDALFAHAASSSTTAQSVNFSPLTFS